MTIAIQDGGHVKAKLTRLGVAARRSAVLIVAAGASMALSMTPASAATSPGSCSSDEGYFANYWVSYHTSGGYDYIDSYNWTIGHGEGRIGPHNNVEARTKHHKNLGRDDPTYHTWISEDNIQAGDDSHQVGNEVKVPTKEPMYVEFKFIFDKPDADDLSCKGHTRNV